MESPSKLGRERRATRFSSKTMENISRTASSTYKYQDPTLHSHSTGNRHHTAWLKSDPRRWQPFVANRVAQIQELTPNVHWNFVSGLENPADCGTRGIPPTKLEKCNLWFNGPDWLRSSTFPIGEFEDNPQ
ncbi:integrase catalytic domain-containing protein [Trichonephila clavipes]|nr:integrase catalytic domain-containing protein [Trichonephila clavipes]